QVLKNSGFVPKWVHLAKKVDEKTAQFRARLAQNSPTQQDEDALKAVNETIREYNSVCPGAKQRTYIDMAREIHRRQA
ncbi:hypothetical protein SARC_15571, partial [Sphaeroforma arctica JP610]